jgi:hypothetical protein
LKKQLDHRWKTIDRVETSLKSVAEMKLKWRKQYSAKEGELEAIKVSRHHLITMPF